MLRSSLTNRLGRRIALAGCAILLLTALVAYNQYASLLHRDVLMWYLTGAALLAAGLFLRVIGIVIFSLGIAVAILGLAHALIFHWARWELLRFGFPPNADFAELEFYTVLTGAVLAVIGYFLRRTEDQEAISSQRASHRRTLRARQQAVQTAYERRVAHTSNVQRCPNCRSEAPGGMFAARMYTCLSCGRVACSECSGGLIGFGQSCPHCGEENQDRIRFHDTGTNY